MPPLDHSSEGTARSECIAWHRIIIALLRWRTIPMTSGCVQQSTFFEGWRGLEVGPCLGLWEDQMMRCRPTSKPGVAELVKEGSL